MEISKERREELRAESALYHADIDVDSGDLSLTHAELRALLDAADERDRLRETRTWLMFAGDNYYPCGGAADLVGVFVSADRISVLRRAVEKHRTGRGDDWWNLYCVETDETLRDREVVAILQYEEDPTDAPL